MIELGYKDEDGDALDIADEADWEDAKALRCETLTFSASEMEGVDYVADQNGFVGV